jgi:hypothetical protein
MNRTAIESKLLFFSALASLGDFDPIGEIIHHFGNGHLREPRGRYMLQKMIFSWL